MTLLKTVAALATLLLASVSLSGSTYLKRTPAQVRITQDRSAQDKLNVEIKGFGDVHRFNLEPMENVWAEGAKIRSIDNDGEQEMRVNSLDDLKVYHDPNSEAVFGVKNGKLNGIVNSQLAMQVEDGEHFMYKTTMPEPSNNDYVDVPQSAYKRSNNTDYPIPRASTVNVELHVLTDTKFSSACGTDANCKDYLSVFYAAVQKRYDTVTASTIKIKLVGATMIRTSGGETFVTDNLHTDSEVYGEKALESLSYWVPTKSQPPHDIMFLMTARDMIEPNGDKGLAGIAYKGAACIKDAYAGNGKTRSYATGVGEDSGKDFSGVLTAAHELAHNLGSPHDGSEGSVSCSWDDGYIMSYVPGKSNRVYFSSCSQNEMKNYFQQDDAKCLFTSEASSVIPNSSGDLPGDRVTIKQQCEYLTGKSNAEPVFTNSQDELCLNVKCKYQEGNYIYTKTSNRLANEGAVCPDGKSKCLNGKCVPF